MAVNSTHPLYGEFIEDWDTMAHTYGGERVVKAQGQIYLPATSGMVEDGMGLGQPGRKAYDAYKLRAVFHDFVAEAVEASLGIMHHKPPVIELPEGMEPLREKATLRNESLEMLLRRINEQQLVYGRLGLLADLPAVATTGEVLPYIATYGARDIVNWDYGSRDDMSERKLNFVSLNESEFERDKDFEWELRQKYRVLVLGDVDENEATGVYRAGVFRDDAQGGLAYSEANMVIPTLRGSTLDEIPFFFINAKDIVPDPDNPPLLGLANLALAIYRLEADYRQTLFMQGQDTLVIIGRSSDDDTPIRIGANARINVPLGGDAKFIGVGHEGLTEQREALANDKAAAGSKGSQLLDNRTREREGGDALKIRVAARTATLNQLALAGAFGLEQALKAIARWRGADESKVSVVPNLDFADEDLNAKFFLDLTSAKNLGFPISRQSLHALAKERELTELDYEDELDLIDQEEPLGGPARGIEDPSTQQNQNDPNNQDPNNPGQGGGNAGV